MKNILNRNRISLIVLALCFAVAGCGSSDAKKPASQVAAKVNSHEISVHQINFAFTSLPNSAAITPEQAPQLRNEVLKRLVDQQLVVEKAIEKKLDRSPNVMMALEAARLEILSRAYFEQMNSGLSKPTSEEIRKYYAEHPQLFAERRVFNIQELLIQSTGEDVISQMRNMVTAGKPLDEMANWLKGKNINFTGDSAVRSAEQIPMELLPRLQALKEGQSLVIQGPNNLAVMRVAGVRQAPVTEEQALPTIARFLSNQRMKEQMASEMKQMRDKAKITYVGDFADAGKAAGAPVAPAAEKKPEADAKPAASVSMEKGVAGLK